MKSIWKNWENGFYTTPDMTAALFSNSKYMNDDLIPVSERKKIWDGSHIAALFISAGFSIPAYTLAAHLALKGLTYWQTLISIVTGALLISVVAWLCARPGLSVGVSYPVAIRGILGRKTALIPSGLRTAAGVGWSVFFIVTGGSIAFPLLCGICEPLAHIPFAYPIFLILLIGAAVLCSLKKEEGLARIAIFIAPVMVTLALALLLRVYFSLPPKDIYLGESILQTQGSLPYGEALGLMVFGALTTCFLWAPSALSSSDHSRYVKSDRSYTSGLLLSLPVVSAFWASIAYILTKAAPILFPDAFIRETLIYPLNLVAGSGEPAPDLLDPLFMLNSLGSGVVMGFAAILVIMAAICAAAFHIPSCTLSLTVFSPEKLPYKKSLIIILICCILVLPWCYISSLITGTINWSALIGGPLILLGIILGVCFNSRLEKEPENLIDAMFPEEDAVEIMDEADVDVEIAFEVENTKVDDLEDDTVEEIGDEQTNSDQMTATDTTKATEAATVNISQTTEAAVEQNLADNEESRPQIELEPA